MTYLEADRPAQPLWASLKSGNKVAAEFRPQRTDDLKASALALIGRVGLFEALWRIGDESVYVGEWAMRLPKEWSACDAIWVPERDLMPVSADKEAARPR